MSASGSKESLPVEIDPKALCIFFQQNPDNTFRGFGSGCFFMRSDIVLTAKHVVDDVDLTKGPVCIVPARTELILNLAYVWRHPEIDLAMIKTQERHTSLLRPFYPSHYSLSRKGLVSFGYHRPFSDIKSREWPIAYWPVDDFRVERRDRSESEEFVIEYNAPWMQPGHSGGPLVDSVGGVVAVVMMDFQRSSRSDAASTDTHARATSVYPAVHAFRSPFDK